MESLFLAMVGVCVCVCTCGPSGSGCVVCQVSLAGEREVVRGGGKGGY